MKHTGFRDQTFRKLGAVTYLSSNSVLLSGAPRSHQQLIFLVVNTQLSMNIQHWLRPSKYFLRFSFFSQPHSVWMKPVLWANDFSIVLHPVPSFSALATVVFLHHAPSCQSHCKCCSLYLKHCSQPSSQSYCISTFSKHPFVKHFLQSLTRPYPIITHSYAPLICSLYHLP